jgi:OmpA-OmpF porin, OOP family
MKIPSLAAAVIFGLTSTAAFAQAANTGWYIAPTAGITINDSSRNKNIGGAAGLAIGKVLNDKWNVEFGGQYLAFDGKRDEQGNIGVDGLYFFNRNPEFAPYAIVGLAYAREGHSSADRNDNLLAKAGLGFTKKLTDTVDFRTDARYQWHGNKAGASSLGDWVVTAGLNIAFGGKTQAPAPYVAPAYVAPAPTPIAVTPPPAVVAPAVVAPVEPAPAYVAPQRATRQDRN